MTVAVRAALLAIATSSMGAQMQMNKRASAGKMPGQPRATIGTAFQGFRFQVDVGSELEAIDYYTNATNGVSAETGFLTPATILTGTASQLLAYFGYSDVTATDLHALSSQELMAKSASDDILVTRFFAPKITDVILAWAAQ